MNNHHHNAAKASQRAHAIAEGLMRTDRASDLRVYHGYLQLRAKHRGGFYWISLDGGRLLRGDELDTADELQPHFAQAMMQAGHSL
jgi:hypothetical protein